ncbi:hypothetical protein [Streptomyces spinosirectus]
MAATGPFQRPVIPPAVPDGAVPVRIHFFTRALGAFHRRLGTPERTNLLSGAVATVFMLAAVLLAGGDAGAVFAVVLTVAVTTLLLSSPAPGSRRSRSAPSPHCCSSESSASGRPGATVT